MCIEQQREQTFTVAYVQSIPGCVIGWAALTALLRIKRTSAVLLTQRSKQQSNNTAKARDPDTLLSTESLSGDCRVRPWR